MPIKAFVSSTFVDLEAHRARVIEDLRKAGLHIDPMEDWTATSRPPKVFSQDRIDGCDLCILLIGRRRGHRPEGEERSITQMEYDYAVEAGLDVLVFKLDDNSPWQTDWDERKTDPALGEWIAALMERHGVEFFELDPATLDVTPAVTRWITEGGRKRAAAASPAAEPASVDVFLSYCVDDEVEASHIADLLESLNHDVERDAWAWEPADRYRWAEKLEPVAGTARRIVLLLGQSSIEAWKIKDEYDAWPTNVDRVLRERVGEDAIVAVFLPDVEPGVPLPEYIGFEQLVNFPHIESPTACEKLEAHVAKPEPVDPNPLPRALDQIGDALVGAEVAFFVGPGASEPPHPEELSRELLGEILEFPAESVVPPLDVSAYYYRIQNSEEALEARVARTLREATPAGTVQDQLAGLLAEAEERMAATGQRGYQKQVIVTTNFDVHMERALLRHGVSFSRIVHHRNRATADGNEARLDISEYKVTVDDEGTMSLERSAPPREDDDEDGGPQPDLELPAVEILASDVARLDRAIADTPFKSTLRTIGGKVAEVAERIRGLSIDDLCGVILYKSHGSLDVHDSCTITIESYMDTVGARHVPAAIQAVVKNSTIVLLGYCPLDPEFKVIYRNFWGDEDLRQGFRYAVSQEPTGAEALTRPIAASLWPNLRAVGMGMGVTVLASRPDEFLGLLRDGCREVA